MYYAAKTIVTIALWRSYKRLIKKHTSAIDIVNLATAIQPSWARICYIGDWNNRTLIHQNMYLYQQCNQYIFKTFFRDPAYTKNKMDHARYQTAIKSRQNAYFHLSELIHRSLQRESKQWVLRTIIHFTIMIRYFLLNCVVIQIESMQTTYWRW